MTAGGLYGRVVEAKDDILTVDLGNDVHVQVGRSFISAVLNADAAKAKDKEKKVRLPKQRIRWACFFLETGPVLRMQGMRCRVGGIMLQPVCLG